MITIIITIQDEDNGIRIKLNSGLQFGTSIECKLAEVVLEEVKVAIDKALSKTGTIVEKIERKIAENN